MLTSIANSQRNWSRSRRMSFWLGEPDCSGVQGATRTVPIVFAHAVDPVGAGFVDSLARPGGKGSGFVLFEYSI